MATRIASRAETESYGLTCRPPQDEYHVIEVKS